MTPKVLLIHDAGITAAIINPAGYTTGHPALAAAVARVRAKKSQFKERT